MGQPPDPVSGQRVVVKGCLVSMKTSPVEVIVKKRDGVELSDEEIIDFVNDFTIGVIPDYQCSAFMMATLLKGMTAKVRTLSVPERGQARAAVDS